MSLGWSGGGVTEAQDEAERGRFRYDGLLHWWAIAGAIAAGAVLMIMVIVGSGQFLSRAFVFLVGAYGAWYAYRRARQPVEFVVWAGVVRATYPGGRSKEWPEPEVRIRPQAFSDFMDASLTVIDTKTGQVAFVVFHDLPQLARFKASLGAGAGAA